MNSNWEPLVARQPRNWFAGFGFSAGGERFNDNIAGLGDLKIGNLFNVSIGRRFQQVAQNLDIRAAIELQGGGISASNADIQFDFKRTPVTVVALYDTGGHLVLGWRSFIRWRDADGD